jgi:hypothetical protein
VVWGSLINMYQLLGSFRYKVCWEILAPDASHGSIGTSYRFLGRPGWNTINLWISWRGGRQQGDTEMPIVFWEKACRIMNRAITLRRGHGLPCFVG